MVGIDVGFASLHKFPNQLIIPALQEGPDCRHGVAPVSSAFGWKPTPYRTHGCRTWLFQPVESYIFFHTAFSHCLFEFVLKLCGISASRNSSEPGLSFSPYTFSHLCRRVLCRRFTHSQDEARDYSSGARNVKHVWGGNGHRC